MPSPLELPNGITDFPTLVTALNDRYRQLDAFLKEFWHTPGLLDYSMGNHRIIQLSDPNDDLDGVNLRTLKKFGPGEPPPPPDVIVARTAVFDKGSALVDGEDIPAYVVGKDIEGSPTQAWIYSRADAPGDVEINFGVLVGGIGTEKILLTHNLILPSGSKGPVFSAQIKVPQLPVRSVLYPLIIAGQSATMCSMGVVIRRPKAT